MTAKSCKYFFLLLIVLNTHVMAIASEQEAEIINSVVSAYGGDALLNMTSLTIEDYRKDLWPGQDEIPEQPDFWRINEELTIDFAGQRKSMYSWRVSRTGVDLDKFMFDGTQGRTYDLIHQRYSSEDWLTFDSLGRSVERTSDTMLAKKLAGLVEQSHYLGSEAYRGSQHHQLKVTPKRGIPFTLYIESQSNLIKKMVREHPSAGDLVYVFSNHHRSSGIAFARDLNFFVNNEPRLISVYRNIIVNPEVQNTFAHEESFAYWGDYIETPDTSVEQLADGIYHVGKARNFSLFLETDNYFVSAGGGGSLKENFDALLTQTGKVKPLKQAVLTHHHAEHLRMIKAAKELGAKVVTVEENQNEIKAKVDGIVIEDLMLIENQTQLADGKVKLIEIATAHAKNYLLVYLPKEKILFADDHFENQRQTGPLRVFRDMAKFAEKISALDIEIDVLVDGHGPKQLRMDELVTATKNFSEFTCPNGIKVCNNG